MHVQTFYQAGFPFAKATPIRVRNLEMSNVEVQFRSAFDSVKTIPALGCHDYDVYFYAEVWFRSPNGDEVFIDCGWGSCSMLDGANSLIASHDQSNSFTDDDIDPRKAALFKELVSTYKKILQETGFS